MPIASHGESFITSNRGTQGSKRFKAILMTIWSLTHKARTRTQPSGPKMHTFSSGWLQNDRNTTINNKQHFALLVFKNQNYEGERTLGFDS